MRGGVIKGLDGRGNDVALAAEQSGALAGSGQLPRGRLAVDLTSSEDMLRSIDMNLRAIRIFFELASTNFGYGLDLSQGDLLELARHEVEI